MVGAGSPAMLSDAAILYNADQNTSTSSATWFKLLLTPCHVSVWQPSHLKSELELIYYDKCSTIYSIVFRQVYDQMQYY